MLLRTQSENPFHVVAYLIWPRAPSQHHWPWNLVAHPCAEGGRQHLTMGLPQISYKINKPYREVRVDQESNNHLRPPTSSPKESTGLYFLNQAGKDGVHSTTMHLLCIKHCAKYWALHQWWARQTQPVISPLARNNNKLAASTRQTSHSKRTDIAVRVERRA